MNNKKNILILLLIVILIGVGFYIFVEYRDNEEIPNDYVAIFNGGSGEITYSTYIYKIDNGQANYGFEYINTTNTTLSWGNSEWQTKITGRGEVSWTDEVFAVAKNNGAYQYVLLPNSNKTYSIEEFMKMFLMN